MLWSLFAREFASKARAIARSISDAPAPPGGSPSAPSAPAATDPRRPSMKLAIEDVSKATSDAGKRAKMAALKFWMGVVLAVDTALFLVVVAAVVKVPLTGESYFGTNHGLITRVLLPVFFLGFGLTLEALALFVHFKELVGSKLTEAQMAVSERVFDDIHFDVVMMSLLAGVVSYTTNLQASDESTIADSRRWSSLDVDLIITLVGLVMDGLVLIHVLKNYRDIYPSVFNLVMVTMVGAIWGSIDLASADTTLVMLVMILLLLGLLRQCYAGCIIGKACCKGAGYMLQFTCLGVGL
ncbi:hypothetical protein TeGR_g11036 [Tetraparma gracilis]|uniref:Uncharacterized protein n=1 Tax=Tetraparma gracilis TaxID=2962635 RepID=A0ABQ6MJF5_9STRA|nr:hypothetical protein TeGR_g11036 [Tetraparma gracilis]